VQLRKEDRLVREISEKELTSCILHLADQLHEDTLNRENAWSVLTHSVRQGVVVAATIAVEGRESAYLVPDVSSEVVQHMRFVLKMVVHGGDIAGDLFLLCSQGRVSSAHLVDLCQQSM
jgi:hypothetical protein